MVEGVFLDPIVDLSSYEEGRTSSPVLSGGLLDPPSRTGMKENIETRQDGHATVIKAG
jgi:hypothetical protein